LKYRGQTPCTEVQRPLIRRHRHVAGVRILSWRARPRIGREGRARRLEAGFPRIASRHYQPVERGWALWSKRSRLGEVGGTGALTSLVTLAEGKFLSGMSGATVVGARCKGARQAAVHLKQRGAIPECSIRRSAGTACFLPGPVFALSSSVGDRIVAASNDHHRPCVIVDAVAFDLAR
jgi:hypothetical protein